MQQTNVSSTSSTNAGARARVFFAVALLLVSAFAVSGCARTASIMPNFIVNNIPGLPELKAQGMVENAVRIHTEVGAEAAIDAVQNSGDFVDGEYYVFVTDANTYKIVAHPAFPENVGVDLRQLKEPDGRSNLKHLVDDVTTGGGWLHWRYFNPTNNKAQDKKGWAIRVGDLVYNCGVYQPE